MKRKMLFLTALVFTFMIIVAPALAEDKPADGDPLYGAFYFKDDQGYVGALALAAEVAVKAWGDWEHQVGRGEGPGWKNRKTVFNDHYTVMYFRITNMDDPTKAPNYKEEWCFDFGRYYLPEHMAELGYPVPPKFTVPNDTGYPNWHMTMINLDAPENAALKAKFPPVPADIY